MARFRQGLFVPKHPTKYLGDVTKIRYMSSWELEAFNFLDGNPYVLQWASEEIEIPYIKPTDGRVHRYYPDLYVKYVNAKGEVFEELIEIKPKSQTRASRSRTERVKIHENITYAINQSKWAAANAWCERVYQMTGRRIAFRVVTEDSIFL